MNNKMLVQQYFDVINGKSDRPLTDFLSTDIIWHLPPGHPFGSKYVGLDEVMQLLGQGIGLYVPGSINITLQCLIAEGDNVAAQFTVGAQLATGGDYLNHYMFRFRCSGNRIAEVWEFLDTLYSREKGLF